MGKILDWLRGDEPSALREDPDAPSIPSREATSRTVAAKDALGLSGVYRAISIRAIATRQMGIDVYRAGKEIPAPLVIRKPNEDFTRGVFIEQTVVSLDTAGNAYWRITRDAAGFVSSLEVLNPHDVTIKVTRAGRVTGYTHQGNDLAKKDIKHLAALRVPGTPYGLGPIQAAQADLRGALDVRDYSSNWFSSGNVPNGVLSSDNALTNEQADEAKKRWNASQEGHGLAVIGNGLKYAPILLNPKDAQFIESQNFGVTQVARMFGMPSSLMLVAIDGNSSTYANVEQDWLGFVRYGLMSILVEIEDAFTDLLPRGQRAKFNIEALLRADTSTRYSAHAVAIKAGWLSRNEVRIIEGLEPVDGLEFIAPNAAKEAA